MDTIGFYQSHLDRVSRSFAFCIARLDGDLREWVSLSYLLCRILDSVEDSTWSNDSDQSKAFDSFLGYLQEMPDAGAVTSWASSFPAGVDAGELVLLKDSFRCFRELHALPAEVREKIRRPVVNMYNGMRYFQRERQQSQVIRLRTLAEVNQYCFFVAGLVGELLTDLLTHRRPQLDARSKKLYVDAHHFGLFLQKINLLKDQAKDEKEGRFLVPSRPELLASLAKDAEGAIRYLQSLPLAEKGFRLFCAWSLFLGLASLPWIERSKILGVFLKIPRLVTEALLQRVEKLIDDNQALVRLFQEMLPATSPRPDEKGPFVEIPWMNDIYRGSLGADEFAQLGLRPALAR